MLVVAPRRAVVARTASPTTRAALLRFGFGGVERTPGEAARIAMHNARLAAGTLLCAGARAATRRRRAPALVDAAPRDAAHRQRRRRRRRARRLRPARDRAAIALHLPLEFAALSLAGGAYMQARKQPLSARALARVAALCALLLAVAAALETYVSLGGPR